MPPRTKRVRFTREEVEALLTGYRKYHGSTNMWATILDKYRHVFQNRTSVDLKDKHRNLVKAGEA